MAQDEHEHGGGDLGARDAQVLWHPYTQHGAEGEALAVAEARGARLVLADGREVLDAISSWWTVLHGHGEPALLEAMAAQARRLDHVQFAGFTHAPAVELAEELLAHAPGELARVFYSDDGSTAVEVALKIVRQAWVQRGEPRRQVFVAFEHAYHGDTFGAMAVGQRAPFFTAYQPLLFDVRRAEVDAVSVAAALSELGERAAGVIVEPLVQGAGGMRMHKAEVLRGVRAACDDAGVPLIADEVMTGFGRTGALFACARAGVAPDLMCLAKGLSGGILPLAATLATERWFEAFLSEDRARAFFHGHSFTANPIACAVGHASLRLCLERDVPARLDAIGARIAAGLEALAQQRERVRELRRTGGIVALELAVEPGDGGYLSSRAARLRAGALERGVLLRPLGNVLYAMPPACTSDAECDRIAAAMAELAVE